MRNGTGEHTYRRIRTKGDRKKSLEILKRVAIPFTYKNYLGFGGKGRRFVGGEKALKGALRGGATLL